MRRCVGSTRFGIEAHEAPENEFPAQPSAKDGLGRMCHTHWRQYTNALRKAAVARKADGAHRRGEAGRARGPGPRAHPRRLAGRRRRAHRVGGSAHGSGRAKAQAEPEADAA